MSPDDIPIIDLDAPAFSVLDAAGLAAARTTDIRWLWHDYLAAGMVTLLTSRGKDGKTTLLSLLLERLQSGLPLGGAPFLAKRAFVFTEESPELWHVRAEALGLRQNVQWVCRPFEMRPTPQEWMDLLRSTKNANADFVAIDSLSHFLPDHRENHAERLLQAIRPLHQMAKLGMAILVMHHPKKAAPHSELSPRGTGALTAFVDILVNLERPRDALLTDRRRILRCTSRLGGSSERFFELTPDGRDYRSIVAPPEEHAFETGWEVLKTVLEDTAGEVTQKVIHATRPEDYAAPSKATLARWLLQAAQDGRITRTGRGRAGEPFRYGLASGANSEVGGEVGCQAHGLA